MTAKERLKAIEEHSKRPLHDGWFYCPCALAKSIRAALEGDERDD